MEIDIDKLVESELEELDSLISKYEIPIDLFEECAEEGLNNSPQHQVEAVQFSNGGISTATIVKSRCFQRIARRLPLSFGPLPCLWAHSRPGLH